MRSMAIDRKKLFSILYVKSCACFFRFIESILRAFRRIMLSTIIKPYSRYGKKNTIITFFYIYTGKKNPLRKNPEGIFADLQTERPFHVCRTNIRQYASPARQLQKQVLQPCSSQALFPDGGAQEFHPSERQGLYRFHRTA